MNDRLPPCDLLWGPFGSLNDRMWRLTFSNPYAPSTAAARILTGSRCGLMSSSSSTTYPEMVPSENVTTKPSSPSLSTFTILICSGMRGSVVQLWTDNCSFLLTLHHR